MLGTDPLNPPPRLRLGMAQLNFTIGAFESNFRLVEHAVSQAHKHKVQLLVLSELATCGYPPRDLLEHSGFIDRNAQMLHRIAALSTSKLAIVCGYAERSGPSAVRPLYNAAALCHGGRVVHRAFKTLLPTYDVFDEDRYFEPAPPETIKPYRLFGVRLGITICEDIWTDDRLLPGRRYQTNPAERLVKDHKAELLINISASPFTLGKAAARRRLVGQIARELKTPLIYVNQVGANDELIFDGHSMAVNADGYTAGRARDFAEDFVVIDMDRTGKLWRVGESLAPPNAENGLEETRRALVLGVRDYLYKTGHRTAIVGLSGGIDSALTAAIAAEALGPEQVTGVAMPSRYSSQHSLDDAKALAQNLGIAYHVVPIEPVFQSFLTTMAPLFGNAPADVTEENLQARARGTILMALSNKTGALVLTTGNKSELAVGYCTLYGDMCGGLAVLSDLPKTLVYNLSHHINTLAVHQERVAPIPQSTLTKPPSAELRPDQLDQDTLPDYAVLDRILELHVEELRSVDQICRLEGFEPAVVRKIVGMLHRNEYKRRQAAPGLKITTKAFGVGRRFPVVARLEM